MSYVGAPPRARKSLVVKDLRRWRLIPGACSCFMRLLNP